MLLSHIDGYRKGKLLDYLPVMLAIFIAHIVLMVTPGPNVLLIAQVSATQSRTSGIRVALGIVAMGFIWPSLAIMGLSIIFERWGWLYIVLRIAGALYLIYLGYKTWRSASKPFVFTPSATPSENTQAFFILGFLTSLSNPKVLVFMGSFFTAMLPVHSPDWLKIAVIMMFGINSLWWHVLVAYAFSTSKVQQAYSVSKGWLERITGGLLIFLGIRLMTSK